VARLVAGRNPRRVFRREENVIAVLDLDAELARLTPFVPQGL
jgi:hypothetical protein